MARRRSSVLKQVVGLCGSGVELLDAKTGWPGRIIVRTSSGPIPVAAHVGPVTLSGRGRDDVERRFQNPGKGRPVLSPPGTFPVLIGLWQEGDRPILVGMEAEPRTGKETRQSLFMPLTVLQQADAIGWADDYSTTGELIVAFHPALLPAYVEMRMAGEPLPTAHLHDLLQASGLNEEEETEEAKERARRATSQLVRDAAFRRKVINAYEGLCALCGIDFDLLTAAHIYPASAPGSPDSVANGLALCGNHHTAFDKHLIWIQPENRSISLHPNLQAEAGRNDACRRFVDVTRKRLLEPHLAILRPEEEMFERRYGYFPGDYEWAA